MAGRSSKLTPELQKDLCDNLKAGVVVRDACAQVGIGESTYYAWLTKSGKLYVEFREAVRRAQSSARVSATLALRSGMLASQTVIEATEIFTETRLRKMTDGSEEPYTYEKKTTRKSTTKHPSDWRAALEYLKRRDPEHWSDRVRVEDWHDLAIGYIRAGEVSFDALKEEYGQDLATQLFTAAGVPATT